MSEGILQPVLDELNSRYVYLADTYGPFFLMSFSSHLFNIHNQENHVYWVGRQIPNMRVHLMFVAPAGWMKSYYNNTMGGDEFPIIKGDVLDTEIGYEQGMTEAGLVGSISQEGIAEYGAASYYSGGVMIIDEFTSISNALKQQHNAQMDPQMLTLLDSGRVTKRLRAGKLEYNSQMTMWSGVQPAKYELSSGLGRRFCYMLFMPTHQDNVELKERQRKMRNIKLDKDSLDVLYGKMAKWKSSISTIKHVEFDSSVDKLKDSLNLIAHEEAYFDRIALGYTLARDGGDTTVTVDAHDIELQMLMKRAKSWRDQIIKGIDYFQLIKIIKVNSDLPEEDHDRKCVRYVCDRSTIINQSLMVSWNVQQVSEKLAEMNRWGMVKLSGMDVILEDKEDYIL